MLAHGIRIGVVVEDDLELLGRLLHPDADVHVLPPVYTAEAVMVGRRVPHVSDTAPATAAGSASSPTGVVVLGAGGPQRPVTMPRSAGGRDSAKRMWPATTSQVAMAVQSWTKVAPVRHDSGNGSYQRMIPPVASMTGPRRPRRRRWPSARR